MPATADPDTIFKALRLVPDFDGNPNVLTRFVRLCDQLIETYAEDGNELGKLCLLNGILNKITGPAARTINSNGIPETWDGIKDVLINNFTDQRDETTLYNDLAVQTQQNSTPQEFYDRCQTLFSTIMTYVTLHETIETTITAKRNLYKKLTMQAFVRGLKEPLGSRIRCMRPDTIEKALEYVQEEMNTMYLQQRNDHLPKSVASTSGYKPPAHVPMYSAFAVPKPFTFNNPMRFPSVQVPQPRFAANPMKPIFNMQYNQQPRPGMPTRTQQMFSAPPPNYNPRSNVFKLPPRNNNFSRPMSGVSHYTPRVLPPTAHDWSKQGNPPQSNYFKTRDVNVNECTTYDDYSNYYYPEYEVESYYDTDNYYNGYEYDANQFMYEEPQAEVTCDSVEEQPKPSTSQGSQDFQVATTSKKSR